MACGRSPGLGSATTTPTWNLCSAPCRRSPAERLIPAGLPQTPIPQRGGGLLLGDDVRGLVRPPAPPQPHPVRDARSAPERSGRCDLLLTSTAVRTGPSESSSPLERQHQLLASARGGLDQSTTSRKHRPSDYVGNGRVISGRGVIFPGSYGSSTVKKEICRATFLAWHPDRQRWHCHSRLLRVTISLRQQVWDIWDFLEQI